MKKYIYRMPKYFKDQIVVFENHNNRGILKGKITWLETHYSNNEAYHIYRIHPENWERSLWIGEENIIRISKD